MASPTTKVGTEINILGTYCAIIALITALTYDGFVQTWGFPVTVGLLSTAFAFYYFNICKKMGKADSLRFSILPIMISVFFIPKFRVLFATLYEVDLLVITYLLLFLAYALSCFNRFAPHKVCRFLLFIDETDPMQKQRMIVRQDRLKRSKSQRSGQGDEG